MRTLDGKKIGIWSLRLDAAYCAVLGALVALFAERIAEAIAAPQLAIAVAGLLTVTWAGAILWMGARLPLRPALRFVMVANLFAAGAVGIVSTAAVSGLVAIAVIAVATDVLLFAASQAIALRALPAR